jgi:hypothetical protein
MTWDEHLAAKAAQANEPRGRCRVTILQNVIVRCPPRIMHAEEELPPELKLIRDQTLERKKREQEEFEQRTRFPRRGLSLLKNVQASLCTQNSL